MGDVIVSMNGARIHSTRDVRQAIDGIDVTVQSSIGMKIFREGELKDVKLVLER